MAGDFDMEGRQVGRHTPDGAAVAHLAKAFAEAHAMTNQTQDMALTLVVTLLGNVLAGGTMSEAEIEQWLRNLRKQLPPFVAVMRADGRVALKARIHSGVVGRA